MIEMLVAALLMGPHDGSNLYFASAAKSGFSHRFLVARTGQVQPREVTPEPTPPESPSCDDNSQQCKNEWSAYNDRRAQYEREMDAWCAKRGGYRLSCQFRFG